LAFGLRQLSALRIQGNLVLVSSTAACHASVSARLTHRHGSPISGSDYRLLPDWKPGADARYVSSVYGNSTNTISPPSYTIFGASLTYRLQKAAAWHCA